MAINAYFRSKKIPTFKDSKKESRFSNKCSSMNLICKIIIFTMIDLKIAFWDKQYFKMNKYFYNQYNGFKKNYQLQMKSL